MLFIGKTPSVYNKITNKIALKRRDLKRMPYETRRTSTIILTSSDEKLAIPFFTSYLITLCLTFL